MKTRPTQLPIWRDASRLLLEIERVVRKFPRPYPGVRVLMQVGNPVKVYGDDAACIATPHHSGRRRIECLLSRRLRLG